MSLDASDWVWTRSTSKGLARTVLLAVADKCPDASCTAYAGTAMLIKRTRAARSSVRAAVDKLLDSGELEEVAGSLGPNGETVYCLPHAIGHVRAKPDMPAFDRAGNRPGPDSDPDRYPAPGGPVTGPEGSGNRPGGGPVTGPEGGRYPAPGGAVTGPQNNSSLLLEEQQPHAPARTSGSAVVDQLRPLVDALDAAEVAVRWSLGLGEQRDVWQLVERHGVERLVELAAHRTTPGDAPKSARYWLKVWQDLDRSPAGPPAPAKPGGNVVPLRSRGTPPSHTDNLLAGLALLEGQENA